MKVQFAIAALAGGVLASTAPADVIITGIMDGTLPGGVPKAVELYIDGTEDLSNYTIERSANGGLFGSSVALSGSYTDEFVYLLGTGDSQTAFTSIFGAAGDFGNQLVVSNLSGNGDDAFRILDAALTVIDQVWYEDTNDAYLDSYMYRNDGTGPDGGWVASNWDIPGNNLLDGLTEAEIGAAVPFGTYQLNPIPAPGVLALLGLAGLAGTRRRRA